MKPHHAFVLIVVLLVLAACSDDTTPAPVMTVPATAAAVGIAEAAGTNAPTPVVTSAPSSTPTNTPAPTATHTPTSTSTPTATPVPPPQAVQLTSGGCCTQPFWSPDGQQVRFIDKPGQDQPVGIWGVSIDTPLAAPQFVTDRLAESTAGAKYLIDTDNGTTVIERRADGQRWTVPARGRNVLVSPDDTRIAWTVTNDDASPGQQVARLWLANLDGSDARQIATLPRGGLSGWVSPDTLLISSRENQQAREQVLSTLSLADGARTELARAERLRGQILSPGGGWVVYYVTFDADPARNGLWVVSTDGQQKRQLSGDLFGSYQWRPCLGGCSAADDRLVIVPMQIDAPQHWLVEFDPATGEVTRLTDPAVTPFKIANGDWRISPDGRYVAYVEASDRNVWVIELPAR